MTTFSGPGAEAEAETYCRMLNANQRRRYDVMVMVDGPEDGEVTVMTAREAIESDFLYRWVA